MELFDSTLHHMGDTIMKKLFGSLLVLLTLVLVLVFATAATAQDTQLSAYLAADTNGIQQVYQLALDGQSEPRQLTHAASDVITFGAAYDGLSVAYISAGQLWLQPIHTEEAEALAQVSAEQFFTSPIFSQDGQYIAYADKGVWLLDLAARTPRQILADVIDHSAIEQRLYQPKVFVLDTNGQASQLIVDVILAEWNSEGVYDLVSGEFHELAGMVEWGVDLLPLSAILPLADGLWRRYHWHNRTVCGRKSQQHRRC